MGVPGGYVCTRKIRRLRMIFPWGFADVVGFLQASEEKNKCFCPVVTWRRPPPVPPEECERLSGRHHPAAAVALPELRFAILCVDRSHRVCPVRALHPVRQHGPPADFTRAWSGDVCVVIPPASLSHLSLCSMPKPLLLDPSLPAHRTHAARVGFENGIAFRFKLTMLPPRATSGFPLLIPQLHTKIPGAPAWRAYSPFSDWGRDVVV